MSFFPSLSTTLRSVFASVTLVSAAALPDNVIEKDVVVLGGGASGAHAAVRLREDYGKSVIVVEKKAQLGGHVATYIDPDTEVPYDFGVNSYTEYPGAEDFFARFNVSLSPPTRVPLTTTYADFNSGEIQGGYVLPAAADTTAALRKYLEVCGKAFGAPIARSFVGLAGSWVPSSRRNQELYDNIAALLDDDVLYSSTVVESQRTDDGVTLRVRTRGSSRDTVIRAKRLLISFEPTIANLRGIEIDEEERGVFSEWEWSTVYVGIAKHSSLPVSGSLTNTPAAAVPNHWLELPVNPFVGRFDYMGGENFRVLVTGEASTDSCEAQRMVKRAFRTLAEAETIPAIGNQTLQFAAWSDHGAMHLHVASDTLRDGFITRKYGLQGRSSTFYTGGAWSAQFTTILWEYNNQYLLPKLVASLE
ncbi:amine oxidase [Verticillium alfalfae VaMs.102]|uniref:Amine oxidase n=1 Tax=Verticillium alfalfae (strain VaMs.102 / ATCC MYA-4576 / FGSC 10136) TaxID=526221 RepID=C9SUC0_VERA1|nr:amine oxidase [Verticillium alfalfae VaMs.102]EEY22431.1 amine oxidase [Verticillium alfalfae VaMs.102]